MDGVRQAATTSFGMNTVLICVYAFKPSTSFSMPRPDPLWPANGMCGLFCRFWLIHTVTVSSRLAMLTA